ncbi:MAG: hypothetical protein E7590_07820 [Ruminococcaceae bacterium]|nr:hypothetical protein [Oscillospiraceae bacterium]
MQKRSVRALCMGLAMLVLLPMLMMCYTSKAAAAETERRFIFSGLQTSSQSYVASVDKPLLLSLSADQSSFTATGVAAVGSDDGNALYIALTNTSSATRLEVTYGYVYNQSVAYHTVSQALTPNMNQSTSFVLPAPHVTAELSSIVLTFSAEGEVLTGTVLLESFFDVSVYTPDDNSEATFNSCYYAPDTDTIEISGALSYAATSRYADATLELFVLEPGEALYLPDKMPVASMAISLNFSFSVEIDYVEEIYSRYVIAAVTKKGERIPLCAPIYPDIPVAEKMQSLGFKGFHTDSLFSVVDSGARVEIVDVYLDRMQSSRDNGILYTGSHSYYYFDETYVQLLDNRIRNLSDAGCSVLLRFLISPDATDSLADVRDYPYITDTIEGIVNKGISVNSQSDLLAVNAFTDFLTARYADSLSGIILGRKADRASLYGYVGQMSLADYAEQYAVSLNLIAGAARHNIPDARIIVPISDRMWPETASAENLNGDYFAELFLLSLLEVLHANTLHPPTFSIMLESDAVPARLELESTEKAYGTDHISAFHSVLEQYSRYYGFLDRNLLYAWAPSGTLTDAQLHAAFALQYLTLYFDDRTESFIVDLSLAEEADRIDATMKYQVTHVDTAKSDTVLKEALRYLGITDIHDLFPAYMPEKLFQRKVLHIALSDTGYSEGKTAIGRYQLWSFDGTTSLQEWYAGNGCSSISVLSRALNARMTATSGGEYADIAVGFDTLTNYSFAPLMRFTVSLSGNATTPYEVCVRLLGEGVDITAFTVTAAGETKDLYLDLDTYKSDLTALRSIRVMARALDGSTEEYDLRLHAVWLESTELDDDALAERIAADLAKEQEQTNTEDRDYTVPVLITVAVLLVSTGITVGLIARYRKKNKTSV